MARRILSTVLILVALLVFSGTRATFAITPTPTPSIVCNQIVVSVNPVVSPTSALTQTITASASGGGLYKFDIQVRDTAGNLLATYSNTPSGFTTNITINLQPGVTHVVTVLVNGEISCRQGSNQYFTFVTVGTTTDTAGHPLVIVQQATVTSTPTPTFTPTRTPMPTITPTPPPAGGLNVQIQNGGQDSTQQSQFHFNVVNTGSTAQSNISVRLYIQLDGSQPISKYVLEKYWDQSGVVSISGPTLASGSVYYYTFSYGAASLAAGASWQFQGALHLSDWSNNFSAGNDFWHTGYALNALPTAYTNTTYMPAYIGSSLVWGSTP